MEEGDRFIPNGGDTLVGLDDHRVSSAAMAAEEQPISPHAATQGTGASPTDVDGVVTKVAREVVVSRPVRLHADDIGALPTEQKIVSSKGAQGVVAQVAEQIVHHSLPRARQEQSVVVLAAKELD